MVERLQSVVLIFMLYFPGNIVLYGWIVGAGGTSFLLGLLLRNIGVTVTEVSIRVKFGILTVLAIAVGITIFLSFAWWPFQIAAVIISLLIGFTLLSWPLEEVAASSITIELQPNE